MLAELMGRGVRVVDEADADVVVINTCTVTGEADRKARKAIRHSLACPRTPVVVVTGCLAALEGSGLEDLGDRVVVEGDRTLVPSRVAAALGVNDAAAGITVRTGEGFRSRVAVKVQDGCDAFCAYCIVPHARGVPRSVDFDEVVEEVTGLVAAGTAEVVLTGINLGRYSSSDRDLGDLVPAIAATGVRRIRLSSIEPLDLQRRVLDALSDTPQVCPHLHVPLQSGSDAVLRAMGRGYTAAEYLDRLTAARRALPGVAITTDVMAGFPGESERDFAETLSVVREAGLARLHVFRYSRRAGTPASTMEGQVEPGVRARRAAVLRGEDARLRRQRREERRGQEAEVLVERVIAGDAGAARATGTTEDYLTAVFDGDGVGPGDLVRVRLGAEVPGGMGAERL